MLQRIRKCLGVLALLDVGTAASQGLTASPPALVFDGVTVIDVEHGAFMPAQRVSIVGTRIQAVGPADKVKVPDGALVVDARGKYLIPGLWDLHVHTASALSAQLLLANGVTGFRDAFSFVPLDTMRQWRREILAGTRAGSVRQILSGAAIDESDDCTRTPDDLVVHTCVLPNDSADADHLVASLQAAGAQMIKMYSLSEATYFKVAAAARAHGMPFGGHVMDASASAVSDSGARIIDHIVTASELKYDCWAEAPLKTCQADAEQLRRNGTWLVPTLARTAFDQANENGTAGPRSQPIIKQLNRQAAAFWAGSLPKGNWLGGPNGIKIDSDPGSEGVMRIMQQAGVPLLAGTDVLEQNNVEVSAVPMGFMLHAELAILVVEGLTPLSALQSATLNPARMWHATDSLGTVAPGKLADLVLLDGNPLEDITNTTTIRAVVANGRYFDRAALDALLTDVQEKGRSGFVYWRQKGGAGSTRDTTKITAQP